MHAVILAGGFATRLWPLTEKLPKPLIPLAGKELLSHLIEKIPLNIKITLSVNSTFAFAFKTWKEKFFPKRKINIFIEDAKKEEEKKGALFAIARCVKDLKINDHLLVIAGDNFFDFSLSDFISQFKQNPLIAVYDLKDKKQAKKFGVVIGSNNIVENFEEKPENPSSSLISTGCYLIPQKLLQDLCFFAQKNPDDLGKVFEYFLSKNIEINFFSFMGKWFDIGSFDSFLKAHKNILKEKILRKKGSNQINSILKGAIFLGENALVKDCLIEDSIILENANIKNSTLRNCVIGKNVTLKNIDLEWKIIRDESFILGN